MKTLKLLCAASALTLFMIFSGCTDDGDFTPDEENIKKFENPTKGTTLDPNTSDPVYDRILLDVSEGTEIVTDFDGLALDACVPNVYVSRGVTMKDIILRFAAVTNSHEEFVAYVTRAANLWVAAGLLSEERKDAMLTCLSGIKFEF